MSRVALMCVTHGVANVFMIRIHQDIFSRGIAEIPHDRDEFFYASLFYNKPLKRRKLAIQGMEEDGEQLVPLAKRARGKGGGRSRGACKAPGRAVGRGRGPRGRGAASGDCQVAIANDPESDIDHGAGSGATAWVTGNVDGDLWAESGVAGAGLEVMGGIDRESGSIKISASADPTASRRQQHTRKLVNQALPPQVSVPLSFEAFNLHKP
jgi:hypothetical protein